MATEKQTITAYDGTVITFYPNSHRYQKAGEKGYLMSPSAIVGIIDKSRQLMKWMENLTRDYVQTNVSEGEEYSKTAICQIVDQALDQRNVKLKEGQDVGSMIHDFAEHYAYCQVMNDSIPNKDELMYEENELVRNGKLAFIDFIEQNNVKFINVELFVYSKYAVPGLEYIGRFDAIAEVNGVKYLIDWKSSKSVYSTQKYQLAGYDLALEEQIKDWKSKGFSTDHLEYDRLAVIHIDKNTGIPQFHEISEEDRKLCRDAFKACAVVKSIEKVMDKWEKPE